MGVEWNEIFSSFYDVFSIKPQIRFAAGIIWKFKRDNQITSSDIMKAKPGESDTKHPDV